MLYEWDEAKAAANFRKHSVRFGDAIVALRDPHRLEDVDDRFDYGEERTQVIGMAANGILFVVITARGRDRQRIISARQATRHEQNRYHVRDR